MKGKRHGTSAMQLIDRHGGEPCFYRRSSPTPASLDGSNHRRRCRGRRVDVRRVVDDQRHAGVHGRVQFRARRGPQPSARGGLRRLVAGSAGELALKTSQLECDPVAAFEGEHASRIVGCGDFQRQGFDDCAHSANLRGVAFGELSRAIPQRILQPDADVATHRR